MPFAWGLGDQHVIRVEVRGSTIRVLVDGTRMISVDDSTVTNGGWTGIWSERTPTDVAAFKVLAVP